MWGTTASCLSTPSSMRALTMLLLLGLLAATAQAQLPPVAAGLTTEIGLGYTTGFSFRNLDVTPRLEVAMERLGQTFWVDFAGDRNDKAGIYTTQLDGRLGITHWLTENGLIVAAAGRITRFTFTGYPSSNRTEVEPMLYLGTLSGTPGSMALLYVYGAGPSSSRYQEKTIGVGAGGESGGLLLRLEASYSFFQTPYAGPVSRHSHGLASSAAIGWRFQ